MSWLDIAILGWLVVIVLLGIWVARSTYSAYLDRKRAALRPSYEYNTSIREWEKACQKSLDWSHARRNKKEVDT